MPDKIRFGVYELDRDALELRKHGVPLRLQEQPFRVLALLAGRPGEIVTREELQEQIWGNTFVDFDQSLNKAVNRVREVLNDNAGTPQYIETVPRRGYRFIAPVAAIPPTREQAPNAPASPGTTAQPAHSISHNSRSRTVVIVTLAIAGLLAFVGIMVRDRLTQPSKHFLQEARLMTSYGWAPALSTDGKLLAYASSVGGGPEHIWLQQTAGGDAIQITAGPDPDGQPDFSPDGTHIVFVSSRKGGAIYVASTLAGEPRLIVEVPDAAQPKFSPSGDTILYWQDQKAFMVPIAGGQPVSLPLNQDFRFFGPPRWAPDGNEILFYGIHNAEQNKPPDWWIAPLSGGQPRLANLPGAKESLFPAFAVRAWMRTADGRDWIIYAADNLENWKLWRVGISPGSVPEETPELLATGYGKLGVAASASRDGKLAYVIFNSSVSIYQMSIGDRGQKLGPTFQLPLPEGGSYSSPSLSRDGKWMAYNTASPGKPNSSLLRDLSTGTDHFLVDTGRLLCGAAGLSISPDGSRVIVGRDCKNGIWPDDPEGKLSCGFMVAAAGGQPEQVCESCAPRGFSSDGSVVLLQKYDPTGFKKDRIVALDLNSRTERDFLSLPDRPLFHAFFSRDDHWVVFKKTQSLLSPPYQILIAPVRNGSPAGEAEWIAVTDGQHNDDKPQFSADGNTVYFTSTRDGYLCIWAQRLNPVTKRPLGPPFAYEHFHNLAGSSAAFQQNLSDLTVARDKMLINLPQIHPDIWMTQMP